MVQADPIITDIYNPQNWNPYSYVLNNPLNLTDPSGYSFLDTLLNPLRSAQRSLMRALGRDVSGALIAACSAIPGAWSIACAAGASYDQARAFGASSSDARRSGVAGAFSAAVATIVKYRGSGLGTTSRVAIAATSGGVASVIQGGKFGHGFVSAGVTARASPYISDHAVIGTITSAIIGGTVSEMTGGKFANGARSGAFAYVVSRAVDRIANETSAEQVFSEDVAPSRPIRRKMALIEGEYFQDMSISLTISAEGVDATAAQAYVDTANAGWNVSIIGDDGTTRTFGLDLRLVARRGNLRLVPCEPSVCTTGMGAANVGGPKMWYSPAGRPDTPVHEMGHVLGFSTNRAYGTGSIMSGDHVRSVTQRDFDLLWRAYRGR